MLGVPADADAERVKRAYRRLVRRDHPDAGGDPAAFQQLQLAYERLSSGSATTPLVSCGHPSRPRAAWPAADDAPVDAIDWGRGPPEAGMPLDRDGLAVWLAGTRETPSAARATSRAPGSRLNRVAHHLAGELTSRLAVGLAADERGRLILAMEIVGATRRARRAIDGAQVEGGWLRQRRPSSSSLRRTVIAGHDRRVAAAEAALQLERQLGRIAWPLEQWRAIVRVDDRPSTLRPGSLDG